MANPFDEYKKSKADQIEAYKRTVGRLRKMHVAWGADPAHTCGTCQFFHRQSEDYPASRSMSTCELGHQIRYKWNISWMACGRYVAQAPESPQDERKDPGHTK